MDFALHPPLTAFPLVLLCAVATLELIDLLQNNSRSETAARVLLVFYAVAILAAFFSGYGAGEGASQTFQIKDEAISVHHSVGRILLFLSLPLLGFKFASGTASTMGRVFGVLYGICLVLCIALAMYTGYLGGKLVFEHGAGVFAPTPVKP